MFKFPYIVQFSGISYVELRYVCVVASSLVLAVVYLFLIWYFMRLFFNK